MKSELKSCFHRKGSENILPNTIPRAYDKRLLSSTWASNLKNSIPVGQGVTGLGLVKKGLEKLVDRLSHGNRGKFAFIIRRGSNTAKLEIALSITKGHEDLK